MNALKMSGSTLLDINPDKLFEEHTISEIIEVQKKLQSEIERKREELRTMVGERYRDMIEAADTISDMKTTAGDVILHIDEMSEKCQELQQKHLLGFKFHPEISQFDRFSKSKIYHSVAIQIKILTIIPEQIWSAVEEENYLLGTQLFLLARHINTGLELYPGDECMTARKVATCFPVIARQWSSISHFRNLIPVNCEKKLQDHNLTAEDASNCLCSLVLLEGLGPLQLLNKLLALRTQALELMLESQQHSSVKARVCNSMKLLVHSISLLHACFVDGFPEASLPEGVVWKHLKSIVGRDAPSAIALMDLKNCIGFKFLPTHVQEYRPSCKEAVPVAPSAMREALGCWLDWVQGFTRSQLGQLLKLVSSLRGLQSIRAEAHASVTVPSNWDAMCQKLLIPRGLDLWENYFQPSLTARAKELVSAQWEAALHDTMFPTLQAALADVSGEKHSQPEHDLRWFMWKERLNDLPQCNIPADVRAQHGKVSNVGLLMKAKGYSPCVEKLCAKLDHLLEALLNDLQHYVDDKEMDIIASSQSKFSDCSELQEHLQIVSKNGVRDLVDYIFAVCKEKQRSEACLLLMARFVQAVSDLSPSLQRCLTQMPQHKVLLQEGSPWHQTCVFLRKQSLQIWQQWEMLLVSELQGLIASNMQHTVNFPELLHSFPQWEVVSIEEEGEEGRSVKSDIRVPSQPSLPLQALLHNVCCKLNAMAPHTLPRKVHQDLIEQLVTLVYDSYATVSQAEGLAQPQALQSMLDVKYITALLVPRDNKVLMSKSQEICDKLEDKADPFDLDVFCPYIQSNIKRSVQRTQSLLGVLVAWPDKLAAVASLRAASSPAVEDPSVLPLCPAAPWFPLLPVTSPPGARALPPAAQHAADKPQQRKKVSALKSKADPSPGEIMRSGAAAFFGAMSSDWFSSS